MHLDFHILIAFTDFFLPAGAGSGIGKLCAEQLSELGANVVVTDRDFPSAEKVSLPEFSFDQHDTRVNISIVQVVASLEASRPGTALALRVDVTDWEEIKNAVQTTVDKFNRLDLAINSAGVVVGSELRLVKDTLMSEYDMINGIDARGVYMCMKAQLSAMFKQPLKAGRGGRPAKRGAIVNISSRAGVEGVSKVSASHMLEPSAK